MKVGNEVPTNTKTVASRSGIRALNLAARTPRETPREIQRINEPTANENVTGKASPIRVVTH